MTKGFGLLETKLGFKLLTLFYRTTRNEKGFVLVDVAGGLELVHLGLYIACQHLNLYFAWKEFFVLPHIDAQMPFICIPFLHAI